MKLESDEAAVLKAILQRISIRKRTGEVGIIHGAERFVSTQLALKKLERKALESLAAKAGIKNIHESP